MKIILKIFSHQRKAKHYYMEISPHPKQKTKSPELEGKNSLLMGRSMNPDSREIIMAVDFGSSSQS
jgi:hypothetical protein